MKFYRVLCVCVCVTGYMCVCAVLCVSILNLKDERLLQNWTPSMYLENQNERIREINYFSLFSFFRQR